MLDKLTTDNQNGFICIRSYFKNNGPTRYNQSPRVKGYIEQSLTKAYFIRTGSEASFISYHFASNLEVIGYVLL
jgi:hypothetical protein